MTLDPVVSIARAANLVARDVRRRCGLARSFGERAHVIVMALRGVVRIVLPSMQWVFRCAGAEAPPLRIDNGDTHA